MRDKAYWTDDGTAGPPTLEDDAWYTHAVVSLDYPKVKRDPKPMEGQMTLADERNRPDVRPHSWQRWMGDSVLRCMDCGTHGPADDRDWKDRTDREGCSFDVHLALDMSSREAERRMMLELDREDAEEVRRAEDERDQWNQGYWGKEGRP